jgi:predicted ribosomally synthesized peptide with nif11-like leader
MSQNANTFFEKIATDAALQEAIANLPSTSAQDLATLAQAHGFSLTAAEIEAVLNNNQIELSDADLEAVNGGIDSTPATRPKVTDKYQPLIDRIKTTKGID